MRPLWKGAISFGLVNIPVKMYAATENRDIRFNYLHARCNTPIQYKKYCPACEMEVPPEEIARGYEYEKGKYVIITEDDLAGIPAATQHSIEILDFIDLQEIDPIYFDKAYYLTPGEMGVKPYVLLKQAMESTGKIAVARVSLRSRESLAALRSNGQALVLSTMLYPEEIRPVAQLPDLELNVKVHNNEVEMAVKLIESLSSDFEPEKYTNEYRKSLLMVIEQKIAGEAVVKPAEPQTGQVIDLMDALRESIELAKKSDQAGAEAKKTKKPARRKTS